MWPFKRKKTIRRESTKLNSFEQALAAVRKLILRLEGGATVPDEEVLITYFTLSDQLQSSCDAVASGRLATIGAICAHADHLACKLLPSAMEPIYYLGIEDLESLKTFILDVAKQEKSYLETQTEAGAKFLRQLASNDLLMVAAFQRMFDAEDNQWRFEDPDVPDRPSILRF